MKREEACGILAGRDETVVSVHPAENVLHSPVRYEVNPQDQIRIFNEIYDQDLDDIAYFHSHPYSEPFPSPTDVRQVHIGTIRLVILSLRGPDPERREAYISRMVDLGATGSQGRCVKGVDLHTGIGIECRMTAISDACRSTVEGLHYKKPCT